MNEIRCLYCFQGFSLEDVTHRWCSSCWPHPGPAAPGTEALTDLYRTLTRLPVLPLSREPLLAHAERQDAQLRPALREVAGILDYMPAINGFPEGELEYLYATLRRALLRDWQAWGQDDFQALQWRYRITDPASAPGTCFANHSFDWNLCCPWCLEPLPDIHRQRSNQVNEHFVAVVGASTSGKSGLIAATLRSLDRAAERHGLGLGLHRDRSGGARAAQHEIDLYGRLQDLRRDQPFGWVWDPFFAFLSYPVDETSRKLLPLVYADVPGEIYSEELAHRLPSNQPAWLYLAHCRTLLFLVDLTQSEQSLRDWTLTLSEHDRGSDDAVLLRAIASRLAASPERHPRHLIVVITKVDQAVERGGRAATELRAHLRRRAHNLRGLELLRHVQSEDRWTRDWLARHFQALDAAARKWTAPAVRSHRRRGPELAEGCAFSLFSAVAVSAYGRSAFLSAVALDGSRQIERYVCEPVPSGVELPQLLLLAHQTLGARWDRLLAR